MEKIVNAWTQWGKLKTVVLGVADNACFAPNEPGVKNVIKDEKISSVMNWPLGKKKQSVIDAANEELNNFSTILKNRGINVFRPNPIDFNTNISTPTWSVENMFCCVCPRDVVVTIGNYILEASMSKRSRFFEYLPYRNIIHEYWKNDKNMKWKAIPKPSMNNNMYWQGYWTKFDDFREKSSSEQENILKAYKYILNESEPAFDAADITRCGKDIFVQHSMTTNLSAVKWLQNELDGHVRVHPVHFPYDREPSHIDCTFVPLRPPKTDGTPGLIFTNPERPIDSKEKEIFSKNNWEFITAPMPSNINNQMPFFCQSSKWLSMNLLSLDENTVVVEENEKDVHSLLESHGFEVIKIPYRNVFEFGGSIHCSTWDIEREDVCEDYFPNQ